MTKKLFIKFAKDDTTYQLYGGDDFAQYVSLSLRQNAYTMPTSLSIHPYNTTTGRPPDMSSSRSIH